jgi:hypothetical protein
VSLKTKIFNALRNLVFDRVTPDKFEQEAGTPTVPAVRYTFVGGENFAALCGDDDPDTDDVRIQLDWIARTGEERDALTPLIRAAMKGIDPPCVLDGTVVTSFDPETKVYRGMGHWVYQPSSAA